MNHDTILAVLPDSKDDAKSLKEIAHAMGLEISSYIDWIRIERRLSSSLTGVYKISTHLSSCTLLFCRV
jgi:hypothetical protein